MGTSVPLGVSIFNSEKSNCRGCATASRIQNLTTTAPYYPVQDLGSNKLESCGTSNFGLAFFGLLEVINIILNNNSAFAKPLLEVNQAI